MHLSSKATVPHTVHYTNLAIARSRSPTADWAFREMLKNDGMTLVDFGGYS